MKYPVKLINVIRLIAVAVLFCFFLLSVYGVIHANYFHIVTSIGFLWFAYLLLKNK